MTRQNKTSIRRPPRGKTGTSTRVYLYKSVIVPFSRIVGRCASSEHDRGKREDSKDLRRERVCFSKSDVEYPVVVIVFVDSLYKKLEFSHRFS